MGRHAVAAHLTSPQVIRGASLWHWSLSAGHFIRGLAGSQNGAAPRVRVATIAPISQVEASTNIPKI